MNYQKIKILVLCLIAVVGVATILHFAYRELSAIAEKNQAAALPGIVDENLPVKKPETADPKILAQSALSLYVSNSGNKKILFEKNSNDKLLIASITKLMTAVVALENYSSDQKIIIDEYDVLQGGWLKAGEEFTVKNLLYAMLINSDNSAAYALSKAKDKIWFVEQMNQKVKDWGMQDTNFSNSVGFGSENKSTAQDLAKMAQKILRSYAEIFEITRNAKYVIYDSRNNFHHIAYSTNKFWPGNFVGVKTGNNELAGECLIMVTKSPNNNGYIINVILNSQKRFDDAKNLINWEYDSFNF